MEEVNDSGFLATTPSLRVGLLGDDALMQAHPGGLRHIRADKRVNEWKTPGRKSVTKVAANNRQVRVLCEALRVGVRVRVRGVT